MKKILRAISILLALGVVTISFLGCRKPDDEYEDIITKPEAFQTEILAN